MTGKQGSQSVRYKLRKEFVTTLKGRCRRWGEGFIDKTILRAFEDLTLLAR